MSIEKGKEIEKRKSLEIKPEDIVLAQPKKEIKPEDVVLAEPNREMTSEEVIKKLKKEGLRPLSLEEVLSASSLPESEKERLKKQLAQFRGQKKIESEIIDAEVEATPEEFKQLILEKKKEAEK